MYGMSILVGRSKGLNFVLVGGIACANPTWRVQPHSPISMNKSQESMVFGGLPKLISAMKLRPEKLW